MTAKNVARYPTLTSKQAEPQEVIAQASVNRRLTWGLWAALSMLLGVYAVVLLAALQQSLWEQVDRLLDADADAVVRALEIDLSYADFEERSLAEGSKKPAKLSIGADAQAILWAQIEGFPPRVVAATPRAPTLFAPVFSNIQKHSRIQAEDGTVFFAESVELPPRAGQRLLVQALRPAELISGPMTKLAFMLLMGFVLVLFLGWYGMHAISSAAQAPVRRLVRRMKKIGFQGKQARLPESGKHDESYELTCVINDLLQRVQDQSDCERRFASDVAHELRTPLTVQIATAEIALSSPTSNDRELKNTIEGMLNEAQHMERLIERLLTLTQIQTQNMVTPLRPVNVCETIEHVVSVMQVLCDEKRQTLWVAAQSNLRAIGEPTMLRQVLMNLVHNAINHCGPGTHIAIRAYKNGKWIRIEVDDDGPGIPHEARDRLFTRFYRGANSCQENGRSFGLGLSIVKALTDAQGGYIRLEDKGERGSCFSLGLRASTRQSCENECIRSAPAPLESFGKPTIDTLPTVAGLSSPRHVQVKNRWDWKRFFGARTKLSRARVSQAGR